VRFDACSPPLLRPAGFPIGDDDRAMIAQLGDDLLMLDTPPSAETPAWTTTKITGGRLTRGGGLAVAESSARHSVRRLAFIGRSIDCYTAATKQAGRIANGIHSRPKSRF